MNYNTIDSESLIKKLYDKQYEFTLENGEKMDIPVKGALGLLAIGYQGLIAWRKKKQEATATGK
jgi:predicted HAD superfamily hydrolase